MYALLSSKAPTTKRHFACLNVWSQHSTDLQFDEFLNVILIYGVGDDKQSNLKRINMIKFTVPKCYVTQVR